MVVCEMEVRILGKRSGAKSRRNMKTGGRRSWKAKGSEGNGRVGTKRRKGETEVETKNTDGSSFRTFSFLYIPEREGNENTYRAGSYCY